MTSGQCHWQPLRFVQIAATKDDRCAASYLACVGMVNLRVSGNGNGIKPVRLLRRFGFFRLRAHLEAQSD